MPFVVNGIGTWYYGKKRIHTVKENCEFCGHHGDLSSYDTTLFAVVFFVPIIPLSKYRVLRSCPVCSKHRIISLKKWEAAKATDGAELLEQLSSNPDNRDAILRAIQFSMAYQDEPLFNQTVRALASGKTDDAEIQAMMGHGYSYFSRWAEAEEAYQAAINVEDTEDNRESLAWSLLKQDRPDDAKPWLAHVLDNKKADSAGLVYHLINGYQAQGRHEEALELMDQRDEAFPQFVELKPYKEQRKVSTKNRGSNKRIRSAILAERKTGYSDGGFASWPMWVAAAVFIGLISLYLGSAYWIGQNRKVYLVNGTGKQYAVNLVGQRHMLPARSHTMIRIPEGDFNVEFEDQPLLAPVACHIETSFWGRPFVGKVFVINPDESAIIVEEESYYAAQNPRMADPPKIHFGEGMYEMAGADFEFEEFPPTLKVKGSSQIRKTRVGIERALPVEYRLVSLMGLDPQRQNHLGKKLLQLDPTDAIILAWVTNQLPAEEALKLLETRLETTPPLVEWHRSYQTLMEKHKPNVDLRPRYRKMVADMNSQADAVYLLGRCDPDPKVADKLFRQAAASNPPSGYAFFALGNRALAAGNFDQAVDWLGKATETNIEKLMVNSVYESALMAKKDYDSLLQTAQRDIMSPARKISGLIKIMRIQALKGDQVGVQRARAQVLQDIPIGQRAFEEKFLDGQISCCLGDTAGYLKAMGNEKTFEFFLLTDKLDSALEMIDAPKGKMSTASDAVQHGLLYLAGIKAKKPELAAAQFEELIEDLQSGSREDRKFAEMLKSKDPVNVESVRELTIDPNSKRVLIGVLAIRQPKQSAELLALAKKLDYQRDEISLCLAKLFGKK